MYIFPNKEHHQNFKNRKRLQYALRNLMEGNSSMSYSQIQVKFNKEHLNNVRTYLVEKGFCLLFFLT